MALALPLALAWALLCLSSSDASAGTTGFLCPASRRLISVGQTTTEVRAKCREPDDWSTRIETRTVRETIRQWNSRLGRMVEVTVERTVPITIDEWTYDFGRNRFVKRLHFENGRLVSVEELGKGDADPE